MPVFDNPSNYHSALTSPQREFVASDIDEATTTRYYGFIDFQGRWIIRRLVTTSGEMRYAGGKQNYSTNWTNRGGLTYALYHNMFD